MTINYHKVNDWFITTQSDGDFKYYAQFFFFFDGAGLQVIVK
jgi:hypothetical protein